MRQLFRSRLAALAVLVGLVAAVPAVGAHSAPPPSDFTYVEVDDGTLISISIAYPDGFDADRPGGWPTLFQMDGYAGGGAALESTVAAYDDQYVVVYASVRGTGCSGGRFDLFDRRHALDGKFIIDEWIPTQPWSNGRIGIIGHSYPGLTGWMVASAQPDELDAIAISGLIDDLYRGIVYPGGVGNYGFPAEWTGAYRPAVEVAGNVSRLARETSGGDPTCAANIAARNADPYNRLGVADDPILQGATSQEDDTWYQIRSTVTFVDKINRPIHLTQQFQDEQTGPRGANVLWERLDATSPRLPKRLVLTNGVHGTTRIAHADRKAWLDCWLLRDGDPGACAPGILDPAHRVRVHFEQRNTAQPTNPAYTSSDWPLPETEWTRLHLRADGSLTTAAAPAGEEPAVYASLPGGRQVSEETGLVANPGGNDRIAAATFVEGPDQVRYEVPFATDTAIAGPIHLTLALSSTATDTDVFVDVLDVDTATGAVSYLQRGMLRASHRAVDDSKSDLVPSGPEAGAYYRAHHPHTNTLLQLLTPGVPTQLEVEVFPVAHVFRAGHKLVLQVHAPPPKDPLSIYAYVSGRPAAVNTIHHGPVAGLRPSSILLPVVPDISGLGLAPAPGCGEMVGVPCWQPVA